MESAAKDWRWSGCNRRSTPRLWKSCFTLGSLWTVGFEDYMVMDRDEDEDNRNDGKQMTNIYSIQLQISHEMPE